VDIWRSTVKFRCPKTQNSHTLSLSVPFSYSRSRGHLPIELVKNWKAEENSRELSAIPAQGWCTTPLLQNKGIFHSLFFHLWKMIFHRLCEKDFVPSPQQQSDHLSRALLLPVPINLPAHTSAVAFLITLSSQDFHHLMFFSIQSLSKVFHLPLEAALDLFLSCKQQCGLS